MDREEQRKTEKEKITTKSNNINTKQTQATIKTFDKIIFFVVFNLFQNICYTSWCHYKIRLQAYYHIVELPVIILWTFISHSKQPGFNAQSYKSPLFFFVTLSESKSLNNHSLSFVNLLPEFIHKYKILFYILS